jgi:hypothetical protein
MFARTLQRIVQTVAVNFGKRWRFQTAAIFFAAVLQASKFTASLGRFAAVLATAGTTAGRVNSGGF